MLGGTTKQLESLQEEIDQSAIKDFRQGKITLDQLRAISAENTRFVMAAIDAAGFPFKDVSSEKAYKAAFLVVLHSENIGLMEKVKEIFTKATDSQITRGDIAFLVDKICVIRGEPQVYGTQYKIREDRTIEFFPIENEVNVDIRRRELGLKTIIEYKKIAEENLK